MAQGYTQPVSGLGFLGFCSAGQRCLQQGRLNCAQPGRPQQPPSSCPVTVEMLHLQGYHLGQNPQQQRILGQVQGGGWESLKVI